VLGEIDNALELADGAKALTRSLEARTHATCARAVCASQSRSNHETVWESIALSKELGVWDAFITAARAWPPLLNELGAEAKREPSLMSALRNASDYDLARQAGIDLGPRKVSQRVSALSEREHEVLGLIQQGLTNASIAQALFISEATVKAHVRHILRKTGARSRTDAATQASTHEWR
jgi:DNA-binding CsgD family transcriptional regulator